MGTKIADWLQNHKLSSHAIAAGVGIFFALYTGDKQFFETVNGLLAHYPKIIADLAAASSIYLLYRQSAKAKP